MKLIARFLFIISFLSVQNIKAKSSGVDSTVIAQADTNKTKPDNNKQIQITAIRDTRGFKLAPEQKKMLKQGLIPKSSDYFKPTTAYCSDSQMMNDSVYVKEFREAAYHRAGHDNGRRAVLTALGVLAAFGVLFILAYLTFGAK